jgi:hypothetical protein
MEAITAAATRIVVVGTVHILVGQALAPREMTSPVLTKQITQLAKIIGKMLVYTITNNKCNTLILG